MPVIAVSNQKGGVGKTTTTLNLGAALREAGKQVLLVDLDPQGNLSVAAGIPDVDAASPSIGDLLMTTMRTKPGAPGSPLDDAIVHAPCGLDVIPANSALSAAELSLVSALNREAALAHVLRPATARYDYVLIDCLPSLGLLAINGLRAADGVVIPVQADFLAMQGLGQMLETVAAVREQLRPDLAIYGVVLTLVDQRTGHAREVIRSVRESLAGHVHVFDTEVRLHVVLKESTKLGRSILDYDSASPSAEAYRGLAQELMAVLGDPVSLVSDKRPSRQPNEHEIESRAEPSEWLPGTAGEPTPVPVAVAAGSHSTNGAGSASATRPFQFAEFLEGHEPWLGLTQ